MIRSKAFSLLFFLILGAVNAQEVLKGKVVNAQNDLPVAEAEVYNRTIGKLVVTDKNGDFEFDELKAGEYDLTIFSFQHEIIDRTVQVPREGIILFKLLPLSEVLTEVVLTQRRKKLFALRSLRQVEGTAIYAGKKSEVCLWRNSLLISPLTMPGRSTARS